MALYCTFLCTPSLSRDTMPHVFYRIVSEQALSAEVTFGGNARLVGYFKMADELCIDNESLISLVEQRPVLWDKTVDLYKNRAATRQAWKEIMTTLYPDYETKKEKTIQLYAKLIIHKWTNIRDNYNRSYRKRRDQKRFGRGGNIAKPYVYSKQLRFLEKLREATIDISDDSDTEPEIQDNNSEENDISVVSSYQSNDSVTMSPISKKRSMRNDVNFSDAKKTNITDSCSYNEPKAMNRHISFFHGILPSLDNFNDDEVLEFQMGVLQLVKKIKTSQQNSVSSAFNIKNDPLF